MSRLEAAVRSRLQEAELPVTGILKLASRNPAASLPYHNNEHNYVFAVNAYDIGVQLGYNSYDLRHLLVAGIFHDYDHTGTAGPDSDNIRKALKFIDFYEVFFSVECKLTPAYLKQLIQATENPGRQMYRPVEQIMRDADMMGWCEQDTSSMMSGLSKELGIPVTAHSTKQFLSNLRIYTTPAKKKLIVAGWL